MLTFAFMHHIILPCLHTFWHTIPTSFYIFNVCIFLYIMKWHYIKVLWLHYRFNCSAVSSSWFSFFGHQGSSQSDPCTITGFSSFKLLTCDWLQKGQSHSHMESSPVWWLHAMYYTWSYTWAYTWVCTLVYRLHYLITVYL